MANGYFVVQNGLTVGPLTIDATNGDINTSGNVSITGNLGVSQISKNDSSVTINDTGTGSSIVMTIDGATETTIDAAGLKLPSGDAFYINGASVLSATTLGTGVVNSSLTSVGTLTGLTLSGTLTGTTVNAATIGNSGATLTGTLATATQNSVTTMTGLTGFGSAGATTTAGGNFTVVGNLYVQGSTVTIDATTISTNDKYITLANNQSTSAGVDSSGIAVGSPVVAWFEYKNATTSWQSNVGILPSANASVNLGGTSNYWNTVYASSFVGGNIYATSGLVSTGVYSGAYSDGVVVDYSTGNTRVTTGSTDGILFRNNGITSPTTLVEIDSAGNMKPGSNAAVNLGSTTAWWNNVYGVAFIGVSTTAKYADLAENYAADAEYEPGTVVCFGGAAEVTRCDVDHCRRVAGVVSTDPAYLMNSDLEGTKAAVALQGRVPCKVVGPVRKGDMMVSAGNGRARAEADPKTGAVIGKALEDFDGAEGVIEVVIGRV